MGNIKSSIGNDSSGVHNGLKQKLKGSDPKMIGFFSDAQKIEEKFLNIHYLTKELDGAPLKVKLVIIDLEKWRDQKAIAFVVSNITNFCGFTQYGLVHTGVQIGTCIMHWFNDSLVHFTDISSGSPLLAADIGELHIEDGNDAQKLQNVSKLAVQYNMGRKYDNKKMNCHHFVQDVLKELGFDPQSSFKGQIGDYLKRLKTNLLEKEFICPLTGEKYVFKKHYELDDYANSVFKTLPLQQFRAKYPDDFALLKAFDRAFWLGKYSEDKKDFAEQNNENTIKFMPKRCPFDDPFIHSFVQPQK